MLGAEIRRLREHTGQSIRFVTEQLGWSVSKLSRIETGQSSVTAEDLARLLSTYGTNSDDQARIRLLAEHDLPRSKRQSHTLPGALERYVSLEERAQQISVYSAIVFPALLQTPEYAAEVIKANPLSSGPIERVRIESRLVRQAILARRPGPKLNIVIDEAVIRRKIGDASIMRRQMLRLIEVGERPATSIRVLPLSAGSHPAQTGQFAILDFDDGPANVFCDGLTGGIL